MQYLNQFIWKKAGLIASIGFVLLSAPNSSQAIKPFQSNDPSKPFQNRFIQNKQSNGTVPGRYRGGGSFSTCPAVNVPLTALTPHETQSEEGATITHVGGMTGSERPTLWFYVPPEFRASFAASFVLQNDQQKTVYEIPSVDPAMVQPDGLMAIALPTLEQGKTYGWYFMLYCDVIDREVPVYVSGGIQRKALDPQLSSQLAALSPLEQAELYRQNQLWYDAIAILGNLKRDQPANAAVQTAWEQLLTDLKIADIQ